GRRLLRRGHGGLGAALGHRRLPGRCRTGRGRRRGRLRRGGRAGGGPLRRRLLRRRLLRRRLLRRRLLRRRLRRRRLLRRRLLRRRPRRRRLLRRRLLRRRLLRRRLRRRRLRRRRPRGGRPRGRRLRAGGARRLAVHGLAGLRRGRPRLGDGGARGGRGVLRGLLATDAAHERLAALDEVGVRRRGVGDVLVDGLLQRALHPRRDGLECSDAGLDGLATGLGVLGHGVDPGRDHRDGLVAQGLRVGRLPLHDRHAGGHVLLRRGHPLLDVSGDIADLLDRQVGRADV
ncbi:MAG: hypothetical protein AVDCRST_MAG60-2525, partial [uncultured Nocardioides sp.]